jgi:hypothetical protein
MVVVGVEVEEANKLMMSAAPVVAAIKQRFLLTKAGWLFVSSKTVIC